ncbi:MAG: hypothetical protein RIC30_05760 [Marinoscillum sp.]|uniref:hypothetical protein n=1 Tax=Marinoscillum sp. TaxID=2024838 RepID=UPI0032F9FFC3
MSRNNVKKNIVLRRRVFLVLALLSVLLLLHYFLFVYGSSLSGEILKKIVLEQSQDTYELDYDKLDISLLDKRLDIINLTLLPNAEKSPDSLRHLYEVRVPDLSITLKSILGIYTRKELLFKNIAITDPAIKMIKVNPGKKRETFSMETGDLYQLINSYLLKFSIDSLGVKSGSVRYQSNMRDNFGILLNDIDFQVQSLMIDSTRSKNFFFTENINLILTNQHFNLADSLHYIAFDQFSLSTKSQNILFKNLRLKERTDRPDTEIKGLNHYNIEFPELNFRGLNFPKAYRDNELFLDSVRIVNPSISIRKTGLSASGNDIPSLIYSIFNKIKIGKLYIDDAVTSINMEVGHSNRTIKSGNSTLVIEEFILDSTNVFGQNHTFFSSLQMISRDHSFLMPDSSHFISFKDLHVSTRDSTLRVEGISIIPLRDQEILPYWVNANIPTLALTGLDFNQFSTGGVLLLRSAKIESPEIRLNINPTIEKNQTPERAGFIKQLIAKTLEIPQAAVHITSGDQKWEADELNIGLSDINLLPESVRNLHLLDHMRIDRLQSGRMQFSHRDFALSVTKSAVSENRKNITLSGVYYKATASAYPLKVHEASLSGFDLFAFTEKRAIIFKTLSLTKPLIEIDIARGPRDNDFSQLEHLAFSKFSVIGGSLKVHNGPREISHAHGVTGSLNKFRFDSLTEEYSFGIGLTIDSADHLFADWNHRIQGTNLKLSQSGTTIDADLVKLLPVEALQETTQHVEGRQLHLEGIDFQKLINNKQLHFSRGAIKDSDLNLKIPTLSPDDRPTADQQVKFESFLFTNGKLQLVLPDGQLSVSVPQFDLLIEDMSLDSESKPLFARNYDLKSHSATISIPQLEDDIQMESIVLQTATGYFSCSDLHLGQSNSFTASIPDLKLTGLDINELIQKKVIDIDTLALTSPTLTLGKFADENNVRLPDTRVRFTRISDGSFALHHPKISHQDSLYLRHFALTVDQLDYSSDKEIKLSIDLFASITFSGESLEYTLPDSLFRVKIKNYSYDHHLKKIDLRNLRYEPIFNRGEFQSKIAYQQDWFNGTLTHMELLGIEMDSLLFREKLQARVVNLRGLDLDTHRDKRLPREEGLYKALPQTLLRSTSMGVRIDTINISSSYVSHSEFSENGELPGIIFFRDISGSLTNLTNDPTRIANQGVMIFKTRGTLMNSGDFLFQVKFDLASELDLYTANGRVGNMDLTEMNRFLENTAFVQIRDGMSKSVTFSFEGNEDYAVGEMRFYYDDLKLSVLNHETLQTKGLGVSMKSFFANTFVVNTRNPHFLFVREGDIFHERDQSKSIFNYWGKAMLSGVVSSIGATNNKKEIRQKNEEIREELEKSKD